MWKPRQLVMRNLADLSRWILETPQLKDEWGPEFVKIAFEACSSPSDWEEFKKAYGNEPFGEMVVRQLEQIDAVNQTVPRAKIHSPVELPALD